MNLTEVMAFLVLPFYGLNLSLITTSIIFHPVAAQRYMLESQPSYLSEVKVCPVTVNITCRADRVLVLRWISEQDGTLVEFASHSGNVNDDYQIIRLDWTSIEYAQPEITAYANSEFDINATISIPLSYMIDESISRIFCGSSVTSKSESFIANATIIDSPSTPLVIRCCTGEAMDPMGFITCNHTSPNETYVYFPLLSKVDMYSVYFDKTILRTDCPGDDPLFVSPNSRCKFERYNESTEYSFSIRSINCNDQKSQYSNFTLFPALGDMFRVNYTATYSEDGRLMEIDVEWEDVMNNLVCDVSTIYAVELRTNGNSESITLNRESCSNKVCLVIFQDLIDKRTGSYEVRVVTRNQFIKEAEVYTSSVTIMSNIMDIIEKNGCNLSIRCPTSFNGKCIVLNDLEGSSSSEVVQLSRIFNMTLSISCQKIPLEVLTFNDSLRVILKYNYTTDIKDNRAIIGAGVAAFIFGFILWALGCIVAFTARFFKSCPCQIMYKDDYRCCWIATLAYSVVIILVFMALLILWIVVCTTAHSDSCPTGQPYLEIIATSVSFVLVVLSTIMLATFILLILLKSKNKEEEPYELEEKMKLMEYRFEYGTKEVAGNKDDKICANCGEDIGISLMDYFCETCGKCVCKKCHYGEVFIYHKLGYGFACQDCTNVYWKENKQFSRKDPVSVISSNMGEKHTGACTACKQDFQGIKICCKSCGNDVCDREKCHCKKIPLKVAKEEKEVSNDGEEPVTEEETEVCSICYMLYQRIQHKNRIEKHRNIKI